MDHKFSFLNFEPNSEDMAYTHLVCEKISDKCPADAMLQIDLHEEKGNIICNILMNSLSLSFSVGTFGDDVRAALSAAREKSLELLAGWHQQRFESEESIPAA